MCKYLILIASICISDFVLAKTTIPISFKSIPCIIKLESPTANPLNTDIKKLVNTVYEDIKLSRANEKSLFILTFDKPSKEENLILIKDTATPTSNEIALIKIGSSGIPVLENKNTHITGITCRLYTDKVGSYFVIAAYNEEDIEKEIKTLEVRGMPPQWFR